ncbi:hypothetical protein GBO14_19025 [Pseudoalteromonas shioyasakiensis]|jgi:hypothetical protein|uniref:STAS/SEC14 domain-containing protein n=1 Tax=Pseudoalteromonas shioyasakiensis TaxID=1190813 RepID=A0ABT6U1S7_9GAMM|nr:MULTISPECIES: hypothetical protein [Pseudoalteromonas]MCO6356808.1 hypothetical protein [Pseudoalteromonas shioyasakiensis]MDI4670124.1 hypothetical protein [Pseudoalteromonas shioyasakiensis]MDI4675040.1 hypothetical protein [Pseudoalteromonas shioyasakiensis]MDI4686927.1 hypothetical protein [Pseudoalteromonas shioyasakiensis]MDI4705522.1 hypothetical protein [Pseudoalteromonas shioyasakiensis]|tara:strand:+ start:415 stop:816 length:402 start_codon:yes stop_codon:yes gene_type:complete
MFKAHGDWRYFVEPPVIYVEVSGSFNKEAVASFSIEVGQEIMKYPENSIQYAVVNLEQFELATADSIEIAKAYFQAVKARGYKRVDYIKANIIARNLLETVWSGVEMDINFHPDAESFFQARPEYDNLRKWLR